MIKSLPLPSLPPVQMLFRPMLFAALGLHALFLFIPFPEEQKKPPENKEAPVKITQLPTTKAGTQTKLSPKVTVPKSTKPSIPKINRPSTSPTVLRTLPQLTPATETPLPPAAKGANASKNENAANPFADFPHFSPSTPNCFGKGLGENCRVATATVDAVASFYQSEPKKKGFDVQPAGDEGGAKFFQVSKGGQTLYLSLFPDGSTTVVLLAPERLKDLSTLKGAVVPPEEFVEMIGSVFPPGRDNVEGDIPTVDQFDQPQFFFSSVPTEEEARNGLPAVPMKGIDRLKFSASQAPKDFYNTFLAADLNTIFTEGVTKLGAYGGGDLYQLKKSGTTIYMSLVPMKGEVGTILVTWLKDPRS
ncbi:hypothetical protein [Phormidesmis priestleyi]